MILNKDVLVVLTAIPQNSVQACKTRMILSPEEAIKIFKIKISNQKSSKGEQVISRMVAREFGVSDKAIRDIWKGRTWLRETMHLDPAHVVMAARLRPPGRPRGDVHALDPGPDITSAFAFRYRMDNLASHVPDRRPFQPIPITRAAPSPYTSPSEAPTFEHHDANSPAWFDSVHQSDYRSGSRTTRPAAEAAPLPESSRADDPFHDDWGHWAD